MGITGDILMALSLCADCFALTLCSGIAFDTIKRSDVLRAALVFTAIHIGLLVTGWGLGNAVAPLLMKVSHLIGFLLLLYVGSTMVWDGLKGHGEGRDLKTWKGLLLGGLATSIDAMAVGAARSIAGGTWKDFLPLAISLAVITPITVITGLCSGNAIGRRTGPVAEIIGGCVLIGIGISLLF